MRGRPANLATRLVENIVEIECGIDVELRQAEDEYRLRLRRLGSLQREALALAQTLTALRDQSAKAA